MQYGTTGEYVVRTHQSKETVPLKGMQLLLIITDLAIIITKIVAGLWHGERHASGAAALGRSTCSGDLYSSPRVGPLKHELSSSDVLNSSYNNSPGQWPLQFIWTMAAPGKVTGS